MLLNIILKPKHVNIKGIPHLIFVGIIFNVSNNEITPVNTIKIPKNILLPILNYQGFF